MGGNFVHWIQPNLWAELVAYDIGIEPTPLFDDAYWLVGDQLRHGSTEEMFEAFGPGIGQLSIGAMDAYPNPHTLFPLKEEAIEADKPSLSERIDQLGLSAEQAALMEAWGGHDIQRPDRRCLLLPCTARFRAVRRGLGDVRRGDFRLRRQGRNRLLIDAMHADFRGETRLPPPYKRWTAWVTLPRSTPATAAASPPTRSL
ncbi:hypothetical protein ACFU53_47500 [Streptomyces sp. NPDC057474]|uniref:hypothetical protein n=1 Tax=Streptomyces sp. NPDC057474 TaxID=3346144 RepID=UPI0036A3044D